jgi:hypothetical protein
VRVVDEVHQDVHTVESESSTPHSPSVKNIPLSEKQKGARLSPGALKKLTKDAELSQR